MATLILPNLPDAGLVACIPVLVPVIVPPLTFSVIVGTFEEVPYGASM